VFAGAFSPPGVDLRSKTVCVGDHWLAAAVQIPSRAGWPSTSLSAHLSAMHSSVITTSVLQFLTHIGTVLALVGEFQTADPARDDDQSQAQQAHANAVESCRLLADTSPRTPAASTPWGRQFRSAKLTLFNSEQATANHLPLSPTSPTDDKSRNYWQLVNATKPGTDSLPSFRPQRRITIVGIDGRVQQRAASWHKPSAASFLGAMKTGGMEISTQPLTGISAQIRSGRGDCARSIQPRASPLQRPDGDGWNSTAPTARTRSL
jgi:hypothetical protein